MATQAFKELLSNIEMKEDDLKRMMEVTTAGVPPAVDDNLAQLEASVAKISMATDSLHKEWLRRVGILKEKRDALVAEATAKAAAAAAAAAANSAGGDQMLKSKVTNGSIPMANGYFDDSGSDVSGALSPSPEPPKAVKGEAAPPAKLVKDLEKHYKKIIRYLAKKEIPILKMDDKLAKFIKCVGDLPNECGKYAAQWQERMHLVLNEYGAKTGAGKNTQVASSPPAAAVKPKTQTATPATSLKPSNSLEDLRRCLEEAEEEVKLSPEEERKKFDFPLPTPSKPLSAESKPFIPQASAPVLPPFIPQPKASVPMEPFVPKVQAPAKEPPFIPQPKAQPQFPAHEKPFVPQQPKAQAPIPVKPQVQAPVLVKPQPPKPAPVIVEPPRVEEATNDDFDWGS